MLNKSLYHQTLALCVLLVSGCDVAHNAQRDFSRIIHGEPTASAATRPAYSPSTARAAPSKMAAPRSDAKPEEPKTEEAKVAPTRDAAAATPAVNLVGKSEGEVRTLLGPPTSVEERAPGKTWHYRDGSCSVDVQLYPDVQTRQFGTLSYEVRSNDNSDEGKRDCVARFRPRSQPGPG
jgi:hypothetical protein